MIAGAAEVTIVRRSLLFAMGRTDATVHVENDHLRRATVMNTVDPDPVHVGQGFNVRIARQKRRLKTPHLAAGCSLSFHSFAANNPPHGVSARPIALHKLAKEPMSDSIIRQGRSKP